MTDTTRTSKPPEIRARDDCSDYHYTEQGLGERFLIRFGDRVRYVPHWNAWLIWDGVRWKRDEILRPLELVKATAREVHKEADIPGLDDAERKAIFRYAMMCEGAHVQRAALELARSDPRVVITPDTLDRDPLLLNTPDGTINLLTGELRPHRREDLITMTTTARYIPGAPCPLWENHIRKVCNGDLELEAWLQVILGYSLLGENPLMFFFIAWGKGKNGKSVTFRALKTVLGDYATEANPKTFEVNKYEQGTRDDVLQLRGARLISCFETRQGRRLAENFIKAMTGGDTLRERGLYARPEAFTLPGKVFMATNYKPRVRDNSIGFWERIRMIPFLHYFPPDERDEGISGKLEAEAPGILQWLLAGLRKYHEHRVPPCAAVEEAVREFRQEEEGDVGQWLYEQCIIERGAQVTRRNALTDFRTWCGDEMEPGPPREFTRELQDRGFGQKIIMGVRYWTGFRLKTAEEQTTLEENS